MNRTLTPGLLARLTEQASAYGHFMLTDDEFAALRQHIVDNPKTSIMCQQGAAFLAHVPVCVLPEWPES